MQSGKVYYTADYINMMKHLMTASQDDAPQIMGSCNGSSTLEKKQQSDYLNVRMTSVYG